MKLIDKDALVTKIDNLKHRIDDRYSYSSGWKDALLMVEAELDTLEVKESEQNLVDKVEPKFKDSNSSSKDSKTITIHKDMFEHYKKSWYEEGYADGKYNRTKQV